LKYFAARANAAIATPRRIRVLLALDDPSWRIPLVRILQPREYEVKEIAESETLQDSVRRWAFDLVILDVKNGNFAQIIEGCRRVRSLSPGTGIVLLSSNDGDDRENAAGGDRRADGLEAGADDYITATVESREFLARIRSVLRRTRVAEASTGFVRVGDLEIDREGRSLRRNGKAIHLTRREFDLLSLMMQKPGAPFTHAQLLRSVWGPDYGSELEYLRAYIRLLRKKIDVDPEKPSFIRTLPGIGYSFQATYDL
jgi:two-component system KDP operon response regulator KdpE